MFYFHLNFERIYYQHYFVFQTVGAVAVGVPQRFVVGAADFAAAARPPLRLSFGEGRRVFHLRRGALLA